MMNANDISRYVQLLPHVKMSITCIADRVPGDASVNWFVANIYILMKVLTFSNRLGKL